MIALLLLGCTSRDVATLPSPTDTNDTAAAPAEPVTEPLPAPRLLRRLSIDLRGALPTAEELDAVEADPAAVWAYRDAWLDEDGLQERLVQLLGEQWHTRIDEFLITYLEYQAINDDAANEYRFERSVGEEPLRLMAHVVASELPWSTVVTADFTMADEMLGTVWPIDRPGGSAGWAVSAYTDGRPAAGVLATNGLWWRYFSTPTNYNRGRVAALTRLLICEDYTARTISFSEVTASDDTSTEDAIRTSDYCLGCHASIDPIASALFGFWPANEYNIHEVDRYHPEREELGAVALGVPPEWFGDPVYGLNELGVHIAADPRFAQCAVETFAAGLWRRELDPLVDYERLASLRETFVAEGELVKPLLAAITETPEYQAGALSEAATDADAAREATVRLMAPHQLADALEALSGFRWTRDGYDQMDNDTLGFRVMAGGVDGQYLTRPQDAPTLTQHLAARRLAEAAADRIVSGDLRGQGAPAGVLALVTAATTAADADFAAQLDALHWRLYGARADDDWRDAITALWSAVAAQSGAEVAWQAVLTAMMHDLDFVGY